MLPRAAVLAAVLVWLTTGHAQPAEATAHSRSLADLWALEVTPEFAPFVGPRFVARARNRGVNTIVLNRHLTRGQKRRVRSLARRFQLLVFQPRRIACKRETVEMCAVVARTTAAVERLARRPNVDLVVLRLRGLTLAPALPWKRETATAGATTARLMLLPALTAVPRFSPGRWRRAISAVADVPTVDLGVTPSGPSGRRAFALFVGLLGRMRPDTASPSVRRAGAGKVVFKGDFEPGDVSQWWGAQCANTSSAPLLFTRGTITVQSEIVAQGRHGARIDLPAAPQSTACEAVRKRTLALNEEWYALEFRLPLDWREPSPTGWGAGIAQLNYQAIWGPPLGIYVHADKVSLLLQSGLCRPVGTPYPPGPGCANTSGPGGNVPPMYVIPTAPALGVWHQVLLHVRWAANNSGRLRVFHRRRGEAAWQQRLNFSGKPTVQWTATVPPERGNTTLDKIGAYRGHSTAPLSVWHDNFCVATSRAAAESCF